MSEYHKTKNEIELELEQIKKAQKNPDYFAPLYEYYFKPIFLFIYKRTEDNEICGDLTQQVFIKALQHLPKYEYKGVPFSAWLFRIASNEVNLYYRKSKKMRVVCIEDSAANKMMEETEEDNFYIQSKALGEAVQHLSEAEIYLLELRFFEERSYREVGDILGIEENNAKVRTYRLIKKIRGIIENLSLTEEL